MVGIVQQVEANRGVKRPKVFCFFLFYIFFLRERVFFFLEIFDLI